jgi:Cu2+-exporting ATPase
MVVDERQHESPAARSPVGVSWDHRTLRLRDDEVFGRGGFDVCARFLRGVFSVQEVRTVEIDRPRATALLRYDHRDVGVAEMLQRLATALRGTKLGSPGPGGVKLLPQDLSRPNLTIHRHQGLLTTWRVMLDLPGLVSVRHEVLRSDPSLARRVAAQVETVHGVHECTLRPRTGTLRIRFDPARTGMERLLRVLESAPESLAAEVAPRVEPEPVGFAMANTAMALSVTSDLLLPPAWPATAAMLLGTSLPTFRDAAVQLGRGQIGLPALYTGIAAATLATGQFIPWAAMSWMMRFWKHRYQSQLASARKKLLGEVLRQQRFARVEAAGGVEVEVPVEQLNPGDLILVSAGEKMPVDGRIVQGHGLLDERLVRGASGMSRRGPEERVHAGSLLLSGDLRVEMKGQGRGSRAGSLARMALAAASHPPGSKTPTLRGETYASRLVPPTLATAGIGLFFGGLPTALAIMRADYASGPGLAYPLESLQALAMCYQQGIVVRDFEAVERLARADVLLIDHHPELEATELEVAGVRVFPGYTEYQVLRYAASAIDELDDPRASVLRAACEARKIPLLSPAPREFGADVTLHDHGQIIKVGNLGDPALLPERPGRPREPLPARPIDSLMVGVNGQIAGLIDFRRSGRLLAASAIDELRGRLRHPLAIGLVSERPDAEARELATALKLDFHHGNVTTTDLVRLVRGCRRRGLTVAYVGDTVRRARGAREADVAISMAPDGIDQLDRNPAHLLLLQPRLDRLGVLHEVSRLHHQRSRVAEGSVLIPNLFCVAGAFFLGFTSLATVVVTNLGTLGAYTRTMAAVRQLERQIARTAHRTAGGRSAPSR